MTPMKELKLPMKQLIAVILCLTLLLAGCGNNGDSQSVSNSSQGNAETAATPQPLMPPEAATYPLTGVGMEGEVYRPAAVMVNHDPTAALRQWGLSSASVIVEALTEGETTNWMLWFDSLGSVPKVGPVAQGKDLFWQFAMPMNSILVQKGMNTYAENLLNCYGWQPLDAFMLGVNSYDYDGSDPAMPVEYNWYTQGETLQHGADHYQMPQIGPVKSWQYFGVPRNGAAAASVTVQFSERQATTLRYETDGWQLYRPDGELQLDANNGLPVKVNNVLVLCSTPSVKDNKFTREYDLSGGEGLYLVNGTWQKITWKKGGPENRLELYSEDGSQLVIAPGKTYMAVYGGFAGQALTVQNAEGQILYPAQEPAAEPAAEENPAAPAV